MELVIIALIAVEVIIVSLVTLGVLWQLDVYL
jgi:hypothetical protein